MPTLSTAKELVMAMIEWQDLQIEVDDHGDIAVVRRISDERAQAQTVCGRVAVDFDEPWQRDRAEVLADEIEQVWSHPAGVHAVVRQTFDHSWSIRVQLRAVTDAQVSPPVLSVATPWPSWRTSLGAAAWLALDVPATQRPRILGLVQTRGASGDSWRQAGVDVIGMAENPLSLSADGVRQLSWQGTWVDGLGALTDRLPPWWPTSVTPVAGEDVELVLPDAGLTAPGVSVAGDEAGLSLTAPVGRHQLSVHEGAGDWRLELTWTPSMQHVLADRARTLVDTDPRLASPEAAFVLASAHQAGVIGDEADEWVDEVADRVMGMATPGPIAIELLARCWRQEPTPSELDDVIDAAARMLDQPGAQLALISVALLARSASKPVDARLNRQVESDDASVTSVEDFLQQVESAALRPGSMDVHELRHRGLSLLGWQLPGRGLSSDELARAIRLLGLLAVGPDSVSVELAASLDLRRRQLLADSPSDEVLAWLAWAE